MVPCCKTTWVTAGFAREYVWVKPNRIVDATAVDKVMASLDQMVTVPQANWTSFIDFLHFLLVFFVILFALVSVWLLNLNFFWASVILVLTRLLIMKTSSLEFISKKYRQYRGIYQFQERERVVEWN